MPETIAQMRERLKKWIDEMAEIDARQFYWEFIMSEEERDAFRRNHICMKEDCIADYCNNEDLEGLCDDIFATGAYKPKEMTA